MPRPLLPTAVKELRGTAQPCRINPDEPRLGCVPVPAPEGKVSAAVARVWARHAAMVDALGVFTVADLGAFEQLVADRVFVDRLRKDKTASPNQIVAARNAYVNSLAAFGLTPQSRAKVSKVAKDEPEDDVLAEFVQ